MNWDNVFIYASTLIAVTSAVVLVVHFATRQNRAVTDRLDDLSGSKGASVSRVRRRASASGETKKSGILAKLLPGTDDERAKLQNRMLYAGIYTTSATAAYAMTRAGIAAVMAVLGIAVIALGFVPPRIGLTAGIAIGAFACWSPSLWLDWKKKERQSTLRNSLPDFLDLVSTCLESGLSFEAALQRVSDELRTAHPVLAGEMSVVQREIELGKTPEQGLRNFAERSDLDVIRTLSTFVEQSRRFGSSMVESLRTHADMLRTHREQRAEESAQKAAVRILFPTLLFIFPPILVVLAGPAAIQLQERFASSADTLDSTDEDSPSLRR